MHLERPYGQKWADIWRGPMGRSGPTFGEALWAEVGRHLEEEEPNIRNVRVHNFMYLDGSLKDDRRFAI